MLKRKNIKAPMIITVIMISAAIMFFDDALVFIYIRQKYPRAVGAGVFVILLLLLSGIRGGEEGEGCEVGFELEFVVFGVYFDLDVLVLVGEVVAFWG